MIEWVKYMLILMAFLGMSTVSAEPCNARLNPQKTKEIFLAQSAQNWRVQLADATPLEVASYLRSWKTELAQKLEIPPEHIAGIFKRGSNGFEEIMRPGEVRLLLVRTTRGVKAILERRTDLAAERIEYIDPVYPIRPRISSLYRGVDQGKPSLFIPAFADEMDGSGVSGSVLGTITLQVPGLYLNL